jgi:hypothetical protein
MRQSLMTVRAFRDDKPLAFSFIPPGLAIACDGPWTWGFLAPMEMTDHGQKLDVFRDGVVEDGFPALPIN